ncbi:MAG: FAD-dependent oxidoreductase [Desulfobacterales bacterium]|jgi:thioredoxin reductase (NADPH)|nr:thioredoxin reductase [Desulfobacter sp.]MDP6683328.1 FAD-dependent oxidoreductase [Desulfobacterales bacterium]MDP6808961.1 FAD-dependent oxidoreductase [Desulfobacterales bacterium]|tara:strand:+ start:1551 stop:2456 length:906 start_codon:yes stop_codon:yes gene_type:complete
MEGQALYDVVIFGTGPAGLQAAIHAARAKVRVLVMGRKHKSSLYRAHVENYCCLGETSGESLLLQGMEQASNSGADFLHEDVIKTAYEGDLFNFLTESDQTIKARTLILAMGVTRNRLGVPGEKEFFGKGVSYCVDCDANFYKNETVAIVGNESAAVSGALTLLFYTKNVHLVSDRLQVSNHLEHQVKESAVQVHLGRKVKEIIGRDSVEGVVMDNDETLNVNGVFIETGAKGAVELASSIGVALDDEKFQFIVTDKQQQTNVAGIYAAGDICGPPWQVAKAVGEGCIAGLSAAKHAKKMR